MLPIEGNQAHAERLRRQIERLPTVAPALWAQVVKAKIQAQSKVIGGSELLAFVEKVEPGDARNVEASAARLYWRALFGAGFRRHDEDDTNTALNYGYAVLRGLAARAVCASGLHPALGLHHRSSAFALADDLMEPARPLVDQIVVGASSRSLSKSLKRELASVAVAEVTIAGSRHKLIEAYEIVGQSLVDVIFGKRSALELPA
jgi:CRISPR-associated protein Cas1